MTPSPSPERGDTVLVEAEYVRREYGRTTVRFPWGYAVLDAPAEITVPPSVVHTLEGVAEFFERETD